MANSSGGLLRMNATRVEMDSGGLLAFLHDRALEREIEQSSFGRCALDDPEAWDGLEKLASRGVLLAYALASDDPVRVEIAVGKPLAPAETKGAHWLKPQQAFLRLPSGNLCLDTVSTWPFGPRAAAHGLGGVAKAPAGDYLLTLYRPDPEALGVDDPHELITLTPMRAGEKVRRPRGVMEYTPRGR